MARSKPRRARDGKPPVPAKRLKPALSERARRTLEPPIIAMMKKALDNPGLISLAAGFVDPETLPVEPLHRELAAVLGDEVQGRVALQYGATHGYRPLRRRIRDRAAWQDGAAPERIAPSLDQVVITGGSQQLLYLLCEVLLDPGDIVLIGDPSYFVFMGCLQAAGARPAGVEVDKDGMLPSALEKKLSELDGMGLLPRVKAVYIVSYFDNPRGAHLAADLRPRILDVIRRAEGGHKIYLVEDAAYRELRYDGPEVPSLRSMDTDERVVQALTFSKCYSPGLRVGAGILPPELVAPVTNLKGNHDFGSPNCVQLLLDRVLESGGLDRHVERLRASYRAKRDVMLEALECCMPEGVEWFMPGGGLYVWLEAPPGVDTGPDGRLMAEAMEQGVLYVPGAFCYCEEDGVLKPRSAMRLSFGVAAPDKIREGVRRLGEALQKAL